MSTRDRELAMAWMDRARDDLRLAQAAVEQAPPIVWGCLFHAQQAAEKALKSVIVGQGQPPPHTHDLEALLAACAPGASSLRGVAQDARLLTQYGVEPRYPEPRRSFDSAACSGALAAARRVLAAVEAAS